MKRALLAFVVVLSFFLTGCASIGGLGSSRASWNATSSKGDDFKNPLKSAKFYLTSQFGPRIDPISHVASNHNGIDMACPTGTPVYATRKGVVDVAGWHKQYGNYVVIRHADGYKSLYAHMSKLLTEKGEKVDQGDKVGLVGTTGYSTGPHLHFTVYKNNNLVDPLTLAFKNESFEAMVYPGRKICQMNFIESTSFKIKSYPMSAIDLDIYFYTMKKVPLNNMIVNYSIYLDEEHSDTKKIYMALECGGKRFDFKDINILYTDKSGDQITVSYTSTLTCAQMKNLMGYSDKDKIYVIVKYGNEKEQKLYSKAFNQKFDDARRALK